MVANWRRWMARQFQLAKPTRPVRSQFTHRPVVQQLEDRWLLSFFPTTIYRAGTFPGATVVGDFNGDGIPDLATVNAGPNTVSVFLGNGDGTFQAAQNFTVGTSPQGLDVGDFNGDGNLDLVVSNFGANTMSLLLGNGDGTFQPAHTITVGTAPFRVVAGDFNNDGNLDVALTINGSGSTGTTVAVLLGNGDGTFAAPMSVTVGTSPYSLVVADLNNDGNQDLAVVTLGSGGTTSNVKILLGNGDGSFAPATTAGNLGNLYLGITAGDLNNDGNTDLVVAEANADAVRILLGNGDGTFQSPLSVMTVASSGPSFPALADFNGDGNLDIAVADQLSNDVTVWLGNGDGTFQPRTTYIAGARAFGLATGDFNLDGFPDLAGGASSGSHIFVMINDTNWGTAPGSDGGAHLLAAEQAVAVNGTALENASAQAIGSETTAHQASALASATPASGIDQAVPSDASTLAQALAPHHQSLQQDPFLAGVDWTGGIVTDLLE